MSFRESQIRASMRCVARSWHWVMRAGCWQTAGIWCARRCALNRQRSHSIASTVSGCAISSLQPLKSLRTFLWANLAPKPTACTPQTTHPHNRARTAPSRASLMPAMAITHILCAPHPSTVVHKPFRATSARTQKSASFALIFYRVAI